MFFLWFLNTLYILILFPKWVSFPLQLCIFLSFLSSLSFWHCATVIHSGQIMLASTILTPSKLVPPITVVVAAETHPRNRVALFPKSNSKLAFVARANGNARDGAVDATSPLVRYSYKRCLSLRPFSLLLSLKKLILLYNRFCGVYWEVWLFSNVCYCYGWLLFEIVLGCKRINRFRMEEALILLYSVFGNLFWERRKN